MKRLFLVLVLLLPTTFPSAAQTADSDLLDAVQLYSDGKISQARRLLISITQSFPENDAAWYYLSLAETASNDLLMAQATLERAVALDRGNYWYRRTLARHQLLLGQMEEGIRQYEALVKDFPDKSDLALELLNIYLKQKEFEKALSTLQDIQRQRGLSEELVRTQYEVLSSMGRQDEALSVLEKFNQEYASPTILSMAGDYYLADFADSLAQARYSEALSLDSSYVPALLGLSEVYRHQRRYPDYFRTLEPFFSSGDVPASSKSMYLSSITRSLDPKILQLHRAGFDSLVTVAGETHPSDSTMLSAVGMYYYSTGRPAQAGEWLCKAADTFPESIGLTATYVQFLTLQERWEELRDRSVAAFDRFHELAFLDYANSANYQLEDFDAIIGNSQYILSYYPKDQKLCLQAWSTMGDAYHSKGDSKNAYRAYKKALKLDPDYAPVLNNYAWYLCLEGKQMKKAYTMSKKTVEQEPDNATYLDTFAWILHLMGKDLEAKPFFKHAMLYGGKDSAVILRHYAEVLDALGESDSAQVYRNQAARQEAREKK